MQVAYSRFAGGPRPVAVEDALDALARSVFAGADAAKAWEQLYATGWRDAADNPVYGIDELLEQLQAVIPGAGTGLERSSRPAMDKGADTGAAGAPPFSDGSGKGEGAEELASQEGGKASGKAQAASQEGIPSATPGSLGEGSGLSGSGGSFSGKGNGESAEVAALGSALGSASRLAQLREAIRGCAEGIELPEELRKQLGGLLGEPALFSLDAWAKLASRLQRLGLLTGTGNGFRLSPAAMRLLGDTALKDIFGKLDAVLTGEHPLLDRTGLSPDRGERVVPYADGAAFDVDIVVSLSAAVARGQARDRRVELDPGDFMVYERAASVRVATVLLLDMSRSMPLRGYFSAAKKLAMAMDALVRNRFPRDAFHTVGFADVAREIPSSALSQLSVEEFVYGTNIEHALSIARRLLAREKGATRQVVLVTDGEPTAHMEGGRALFAYPPVPATLTHTLAEVVRCTRAGIRINTFMLDDSPELVGFVERISRINSGRTFLARPERLGEYVLLDYVTSRV